jgi:hypothetical protein
MTLPAQLKLLPIGMNPLLELCRGSTICDELLQSFEFIYRTSFEALRVMEDEFAIAAENQFVLDVVNSALACIGKDVPHVSVRYVVILTPHGSLNLGQINLAVGFVDQSSICIKPDTHLLSFSIIHSRVFGSVTDRAEDSRLASVRSIRILKRPNFSRMFSKPPVLFVSMIKYERRVEVLGHVTARARRKVKCAADRSPAIPRTYFRYPLRNGKSRLVGNIRKGFLGGVGVLHGFRNSRVDT